METTQHSRRFVDPESLICPECGEKATPIPPAYWVVANGPRPDFSHEDREPLCPVMTKDGYRPALPVLKAGE